MPALSDLMLASGCALHIEATHGEWIEVLSGQDIGLKFLCVKENDPDAILESQLGSDRRAKRFIRFRNGNVPRFGGQDQVRTEDGRKWNVVKSPQDGFLTSDFELREIVNGKDS
jgi:hypothetical protein